MKYLLENIFFNEVVEAFLKLSEVGTFQGDHGQPQGTVSRLSPLYAIRGGTSNRLRRHSRTGCHLYRVACSGHISSKCGRSDL